MKKFRTIRQLVSSVLCIVLAITVVLLDYSDGNPFMQILLIFLGTGVFYCVFGLSGLIIRLISKNGFIKNSTTWNCVLDTFIYLALCVGSFFLVTFICSKVIWLGLLFTLGGIAEVCRDINYMVKLDAQKNADNNDSLENTDSK